MPLHTYCLVYIPLQIPLGMPRIPLHAPCNRPKSRKLAAAVGIAEDRKWKYNFSHEPMFLFLAERGGRACAPRILSTGKCARFPVLVSGFYISPLPVTAYVPGNTLSSGFRFHLVLQYDVMTRWCINAVLWIQQQYKRETTIYAAAHVRSVNSTCVQQ